MPFTTIDVPLNLGARRDLTELASNTVPAALAVCENAAFTREGEVSLRPCAVSEDGNTLHASAPGLPSFMVSSIDSEPDLRIGLSTFDGDPVIQAHARMWRKRAGVWTDTGPFWSVRADYSQHIGEAALSDPDIWPHVGTTLTAFPSSNPIANYQDTEGGYPSANGSTVVGAKTDSRCAVGDALFTTDGANVRMLKGFPLETRTLIATDALVSGATNSPQRLWGCLPVTGSGYYLVYQTNAGSVKLLRLSSAGAILNTLTLTTGILASGSAALSLGLSTNATSILLAATGTNDTILTKVITVASWTDAGLDLVHTEGIGIGAFSRVGCGITLAGIGYTTASFDQEGHVRILVRDTASATAILSKRFHGWGSATTNVPFLGYRTLFPPLVLSSGRVLAGFQTAEAVFGVYNARTPATWMVMDITQDIRPISLVAAGEEGSSMVQAGMGSAALVGEGIAFGILDGISFDPGQVAAARAQRITLTPVPASSVEVNGIRVFTGQYPYCLDGLQSFEGGFPTSPVIWADPAAGGTIATGSRTVAACWSWVDAQGNTHRSQPSNLMTVTVGATQGVRMIATLPQWAQSRPPESFRLEMYSTVENPSQDADLFMAKSQALTTLNAATATITYLNDPIPALNAQEALYTGGGILANERGFANNGLAVVGGRVWTAEGTTAYASKLIRPGAAPAWSTDDSLQLEVPSGYGEIRALGGLDNMLVLICKEATLVFTGNGPGDAGGPSDFSEPRRVYRATGPTNPGDVTEAATGVIWTSTTGEAHAIAPGGGCVNIGRPSQDVILQRPVFLLGGNRSNDLVAFMTNGNTRLEVLDLSVGQWSAWTFPWEIADIGVKGNSLCLLVNGDPFVVSLSEDQIPMDEMAGGSTQAASLLLRTRLLPLGHLGKLKSVKPLGLSLASPGDITMNCNVLSDQHQASLTGNSHTVALQGETTDWPRSEMPEFRTGTQRMESFAIELQFTPGAVRLTGLQAEVMDNNTMPRNQRS
jgi:hypothetical protein